MKEKKQIGYRNTAKRTAVTKMLFLVTLAALVLTIQSLPAEGFRNPPAGALDLGQAGGRIALVDDSSAAVQNPANLLELTNAEFQFAPTIVNIKANFSSPTGQSAESKDPWKFLPNAFGAVPFADGRFAASLAITTPYGLGSDWNQNSSAFARPTGIWRYQTPYTAELTTVNISPGIAAKLGEHVRLGAGLDVMWSELTLKQFYPWLIFPNSTGVEPDGNLNATGDGIGVGGNAGLTWLVTERQSLAVTYRSPMTVHYSGDFTIDNITPTAAFLGATPRSDLSTKIGFPTIVAAGYGIRLTDTVGVETDVEWLQFSRFKSLDLNAGNNSFLLPSTSIPENWKDTFTLGIAGYWCFADNWVLRAGYQYYQSPIPDSTFSPSIPDADQNVFTVGLCYHYKRHSLEGAYGLDIYNTRNITNDQNPAFNGTYKLTVNLFSLSYRFSF
jgi:long-chain fatty acid transport protein